MKQKKQIYFSRTYRHLSINKLETVLYIILFAIPALILLLFYYSDLTYIISKISVNILEDYIPINFSNVGSGEFLSLLGDVKFLKIPNVVPSIRFIIINFIITFIFFVFFSTGKRSGKPVSVYMVMLLLTHISSCIFFYFFSKYFPYTASEYSELYIKQEVSIWIFFVIISGIITGLLGFRGIILRMITVISIMTYSFIFGAVRYIFFLYVIYKFSILYMPVLFFMLGPLFDFLYFVFFYGIYIDGSIKRYESDKGRDQWEWA